MQLPEPVEALLRQLKARFDPDHALPPLPIASSPMM
jgi:hypothetical protein